MLVVLRGQEVRTMQFSRALCSLLCVGFARSVVADQITFAYEGDIPPSDPSSGLAVFDACDQACTQTIENGFLTLSWQGPGSGDRQVNFNRDFGPFPTDPPALPFWIEWRFASNFPLGPNFFDSDSAMVLFSDPISMYLNMYGDAIVIQDASLYLSHLELNAFRTFRFETQDGLNFCIWYDGN